MDSASSPAMEIEAPGIILAASPYGEGDAVASIFFEEHGIYRGLARGAQSRAKAAIWQTGNLVEARWLARLSDQLGTFTAEQIHASAALAMHDPMALAILLSVCAVADGALPERQPQPRIFRGLLHLIAHASESASLLPEVIHWELGVLRELGYGLDLSECALTGTTDSLAYVSPRTGRAVCEEAAGLWKERLLKLPAFLTRNAPATPEDLADGLRLTRHFLARDAFGLHHRPLPPARDMLEQRVRAI
jgi:DNA repair protein RecO (recombination protein O)